MIRKREESFGFLSIHASGGSFSSPASLKSESLKSESDMITIPMIKQSTDKDYRKLVSILAHCVNSVSGLALDFCYGLA